MSGQGSRVLGTAVHVRSWRLAVISANAWFAAAADGCLRGWFLVSRADIAEASDLNATYSLDLSDVQRMVRL